MIQFFAFGLCVVLFVMVADIRSTVKRTDDNMRRVGQAACNAAQ